MQVILAEAFSLCLANKYWELFEKNHLQAACSLINLVYFKFFVFLIAPLSRHFLFI